MMSKLQKWIISYLELYASAVHVPLQETHSIYLSVMVGNRVAMTFIKIDSSNASNFSDRGKVL